MVGIKCPDSLAGCLLQLRWLGGFAIRRSPHVRSRRRQILHSREGGDEPLGRSGDQPRRSRFSAIPLIRLTFRRSTLAAVEPALPVSMGGESQSNERGFNRSRTSNRCLSSDKSASGKSPEPAKCLFYPRILTSDFPQCDSANQGKSWFRAAAPGATGSESRLCDHSARLVGQFGVPALDYFGQFPDQRGAVASISASVLTGEHRRTEICQAL